MIGTVSCEKKEDVPPQVELKVTSYYPNSGKAGTLVTIEGEGFGTSIGDYQATIGGEVSGSNQCNSDGTRVAYAGGRCIRKFGREIPG